MVRRAGTADGTTLGEVMKVQDKLVLRRIKTDKGSMEDIVTSLSKHQYLRFK